MPDLQTLLNELNQSFSSEGAARLAPNCEAFSQGNKLGSGLIVTKGSPLFDQYEAYLAWLPGAIQETIRSVMYYALTTRDEKGKHKPTSITFAWMPGYDFKVTVTEVGDTTRTRGGITILIESPYDKKSLLKQAPAPVPAKKPAPKRPNRPK
jgi:hypothetical protein